eukprot:7355321-Prymnesium_polylepis.1
MSALSSTTPWVSAELSPGTLVGEAWVYAREDCCLSQLSPFEVWIADTAGASGVTEGAVQCGSLQSVPASAGPHVVVCDGLHSASHVTLVLPGTGRVVMVAELQLWGALGPPTPPSLPPPSSPPPVPPPP